MGCVHILCILYIYKGFLSNYYLPCSLIKVEKCYLKPGPANSHSLSQVWNLCSQQHAGCLETPHFCNTDSLFHLYLLVMKTITSEQTPSKLPYLTMCKVPPMYLSYLIIFFIPFWQKRRPKLRDICNFPEVTQLKGLSPEFNMCFPDLSSAFSLIFLCK